MRNATEAINLVAYTWGRRNIRQADTIVLTELEHHSNLVPWQLLVQEKDADLEFVAIDEQGRLDQESFEVLLRTRPKLVAFTQVSNALGTINPAREMVDEGPRRRRARARRRRPERAPRPVDVQDIGADFFVFSGHKVLGPTGSGVAVGTPRAAGGDAAVHGRRRDDPRGPPAPHHVQRRALEVRGGHAGHRRGHRAGCRARVSRGPRHGPGAGARASPHGVRARGPASRGARHPHHRPGIRRRAGRHRHVHPARASTPTTWRRSSTARPSPSGPAITAPSRSTNASASRRPRAPASTSTPRPRTSTGWRRVCARSSRSSAGTGTRPAADRLRRRAPIRYPVTSHGRPVPRRDPGALPPAAQLRHAADTRRRRMRARTRCAATGSTLMLDLDESGTVTDVAFTGRGCAISQASASMLTDTLRGRTTGGAGPAGQGRCPRPAGHRHQPGAPQVRAALAGHPPASTCGACGRRRG